MYLTGCLAYYTTRTRHYRHDGLATIGLMLTELRSSLSSGTTATNTQAMRTTCLITRLRSSLASAGRWTYRRTSFTQCFYVSLLGVLRPSTYRLWRETTALLMRTWQLRTTLTMMSITSTTTQTGRLQPSLVRAQRTQRKAYTRFCSSCLISCSYASAHLARTLRAKTPYALPLLTPAEEFQNLRWHSSS